MFVLQKEDVHVYLAKQPCYPDSIETLDCILILLKLWIVMKLWIVIFSGCGCCCFLYVHFYISLSQCQYNPQDTYT